MINIEINNRNGVPSTNFELGLYLSTEELHLGAIDALVVENIVANL